MAPSLDLLDLVFIGIRSPFHALSPVINRERSISAERWLAYLKKMVMVIDSPMFALKQPGRLVIASGSFEMGTVAALGASNSTSEKKR